MSQILMPMFSFKSFIILSLTFKSLFHLDFIQVCGVISYFCVYLFNFLTTI